jgi:hypothetical protein
VGIDPALEIMVLGLRCFDEGTQPLEQGIANGHGSLRVRSFANINFETEPGV